MQRLSAAPPAGLMLVATPHPRDPEDSEPAESVENRRHFLAARCSSAMRSPPRVKRCGASVPVDGPAAALAWVEERLLDFQWEQSISRRPEPQAWDLWRQEAEGHRQWTLQR